MVKISTLLKHVFKETCVDLSKQRILMYFLISAISGTSIVWLNEVKLYNKDKKSKDLTRNETMLNLNDKPITKNKKDKKKKRLLLMVDF